MKLPLNQYNLDEQSFNECHYMPLPGSRCGNKGIGEK